MTGLKVLRKMKGVKQGNAETLLQDIIMQLLVIHSFKIRHCMTLE